MMTSEQWYKLRNDFEKELRETVGFWALSQGPAAMTFEEARELIRRIIFTMNKNFSEIKEIVEELKEDRK